MLCFCYHLIKLCFTIICMCMLQLFHLCIRLYVLFFSLVNMVFFCNYYVDCMFILYIHVHGLDTYSISSFPSFISSFLACIWLWVNMSLIYLHGYLWFLFQIRNFLWLVFFWFSNTSIHVILEAKGVYKCWWRCFSLIFCQLSHTLKLKLNFAP